MTPSATSCAMYMRWQICAWPNDGVTVMPADALTAIIDIQMTACRALGLPEEMNLLTGNPAFDDF